jgi:hypothetical protein
MLVTAERHLKQVSKTVVLHSGRSFRLLHFGWSIGGDKYDSFFFDT